MGLLPTAHTRAKRAQRTTAAKVGIYAVCLATMLFAGHMWSKREGMGIEDWASSGDSAQGSNRKLEDEEEVDPKVRITTVACHVCWVCWVCVILSLFVANLWLPLYEISPDCPAKRPSSSISA